MRRAPSRPLPVALPLKEGNFEQIEADVSRERGVYIEVHDPTEVEHHPRLDAKIYPFNLKAGNFVSEPREPCPKAQRT